MNSKNYTCYLLGMLSRKITRKVARAQEKAMVQITEQEALMHIITENLADNNTS